MNAFQTLLSKKSIAFILLSSLLTAILLLLNWTAYTYSVVRQDEIALNASALQPWTSWFTSGFANYFNPYPEFTSNTTNFIRPVVNIFYWIFWKLDIGLSNQLIIFCYAIHAMTVATIFHVAQRQSLFDALIAASVMFFSAAFWPWGLPSPVYGSEFLAAFMTMLAILALLNRRRAIAIVLLLLSVLTKETSLPVIVGLALVTFLVRDYKTSVLCIILIAGYFLARHINFGSFVGGVYAAPSFAPRSIFTVLTFPISYGTLKDLKTSVFDLKLAPVQILIALNLVVIGIALRCLYVWRSVVLDAVIRIRSGLSERERSFVILLVCFAASLAYYVFVARVARFSYQTLAFFLLTLSFLPLQIERRLIIILALIGNLIGFGQAYSAYYGRYDVDRVKSHATDSLRHMILNLKTQDRIYTVNDIVTEYSKPSDFARIYGAKLDIHKGSSVEMIACPMTELQQIITSVMIVGNEKKITTSLPPCADFVFESASREKMQASVQDGWLIRNAQIAYQFHADDTSFSLGDILLTQERYPRTMTVRIRDASVLYFDLQAKVWRFIE